MSQYDPTTAVFTANSAAGPLMLNTLPTVVTQAGAYITRCGFRADVYAIIPQVGVNTTELRVKGNIHYPPTEREIKKNIRISTGFFIWHVSGRGYPIHESGLDIVGVWPHGDLLLTMSKMPDSTH